MPISQSSRAMDTRSMEREHLVNMISNSMLFERIIHNKMFANIDIFDNLLNGQETLHSDQT